MVGEARADSLPDSLRTQPDNVVLHDEGRLRSFESLFWFGPEIGFAHTIADLWPGDTIVLIKYAVGATSIYCWHPEFHIEPVERIGLPCDTLYVRLMEHIAHVRAQRNVRIAGMLWMQGEADAAYTWAANEYLSNLQALIDSVRSHLSLPELPFVLGRIREGGSAAAIVRQAQEEVPYTRSNVKMIDTDDLGVKDDSVHYDHDGQIALGRRFAEVYREFAVPVDEYGRGRMRGVRLTRHGPTRVLCSERCALRVRVWHDGAAKRTYSLLGRHVVDAPGQTRSIHD
jgi:hypothetical protein